MSDSSKVRPAIQRNVVTSERVGTYTRYQGSPFHSGGCMGFVQAVSVNTTQAEYSNWSPVAR